LKSGSGLELHGYSFWRVFTTVIPFISPINSHTMITIQNASNADIESINKLLKDVDLPFLESSDNTDYFFKAMNSKNEIVGAIGLEVYGEYGLLRSLVVSNEYRNKGIANDLVGKFVNISAELNLKGVYLLTTTADKYFEKHYFVRIQRNNVPDEVKQSKEFASICPVSAIVMERNLN
jgi:amino-acid N-acetyltransferase